MDHITLIMQSADALEESDSEVILGVLTDLLNADASITLGSLANGPQPFAAVNLPAYEDRVGDEQQARNLTYMGKPGDDHITLLAACLHSMTHGPVHRHDCDDCEYVGTYPRRHGGWADVWLSCQRGAGYKYIVRYGLYGAYATTNDPGHYCRCALI